MHNLIEVRKWNRRWHHGAVKVAKWGCDSGARVANYDWRIGAEMDSTHCINCHHLLIA
jgi:hypothetical protein